LSTALAGTSGYSRAAGAAELMLHLTDFFTSGYDIRR
jgi:hypothetical protein